MLPCGRHKGAHYHAATIYLQGAFGAPIKAYFNQGARANQLPASSIVHSQASSSIFTLKDKVGRTNRLLILPNYELVTHRKAGQDLTVYQ